MSQFVVSTAAADRSLLTTEELRAAVGVTGSSHDATLATLGARAAAAIAAWCGVADGAPAVPTLRSEGITETFRALADVPVLVMARWPVTSIASVTLDGAVLAATGYELADGNRLLYRLSDDVRISWNAAKVVIVYTAGWSTVPDGLKAAAVRLVRDYWYADGPQLRDPALKRVRVDGVDEVEYWVSPASDPLVAGEVADMLAPYRTLTV